MDERIGFGLYQSCVNRGSVGRVSVFWLRWCGWCRWGCGGGCWLGPGSGGVVWCYVCVSCNSGIFVYMAGPGICILCLAETCASEVHPVFNPVARLLNTIRTWMLRPFLDSVHMT